jgi:hypothetical protein
MTRPSKYTLRIPNWTPTLTNRLLSMHWGASGRAKRLDAQMIAAYAKMRGIYSARSGPIVPFCGIKRRVSLEVHGWSRGRKPDPDAFWKSLLDGLVKADLLVDDSAQWCECGPVQIVQDTEKYTVIKLEDIGC